MDAAMFMVGMDTTWHSPESRGADKWRNPELWCIWTNQEPSDCPKKKTYRNAYSFKELKTTNSFTDEFETESTL